MSQTSTSTNTNNGHNRNSGKDGRGQGAPNDSSLDDCLTNCGNKSIAKYSFKRKIIDSRISKLAITETGYRPSQFKKIYDTLLVFYTDKNYSGLDEVICTGRDKVEDDFMPAYPNANLWSTTHQIQVASVLPEAALVEGITANKRVVTYKLVEQIIITNANL